MCCIFALSLIAHCIGGLCFDVFPYVHMATHIPYIIMAPIVGVRMREEKEMNRVNVELIDKFSIINECAD